MKNILFILVLVGITFSGLAFAQGKGPASSPTPNEQKVKPDEALIKDWKTSELPNKISKEGIIKITGSGINTRVTLIAADNEKDFSYLCPGDVSRRIGRISGMTVRIAGVWQDPPQVPSKCLEPKDFEVLKAESGRAPLVGVLQNKDGQYVIEGAQGAPSILTKVPKGLQDKIGKKVIVDVKPFPTGSSKTDDAWKVVSYADYP